MSKENFQYNGLLGITFIDKDGNEMPAADAMKDIDSENEEGDFTDL